MIVRMVYLLPMILGRTFDIGKNKIGVDIFPMKDVQNPKEIAESFYRSNYKIVESSTDVKDVLEITGDLSLNIKSGTFAIRGIGAYVKSTLHSESSVDILTKVSSRTISKSLPNSAKPVSQWKTIPREYLGTHYVKSILYGGDLIACIRFKAKKIEDLKDIRGTIKTSLEGGSALDLVGEGKLESLDKKLEKKATMEIFYFATVPIEGVPNNIEGLRDLVRGFEDHVKKVNGGIGVPVEVELGELATFDRGFEHIKNTELETELDFFEEELDDLLSTKNRLKKFVEEFPDPFDKSQEKEISNLSERISKVLRKFLSTLANLDLEKGSDQLDEAKEVYRENEGLGMPGKFRKDMNKLLKKIVPKSDYNDKSTSVYVHYGSRECSSDKITVKIHSGYLASSPRTQLGGGSNYLCIPEKPVIQISPDDPKIANLSLLAGVKYGLMETRPSHAFDTKSVLRGVRCSVCLVQRHTVHIFPGEKECPSPGLWNQQYSGYLMTSTDIERSETVCVDDKRESNQDTYMGQHDQSLNFATIKTSDGSVEFIPCVVCSK